MRKPIAAICLFLLLGLSTANAVEPQERLANPALEGRAREISKELRCLVCQNQSIDDSDAELARDLRRIVRERLKAGDTDNEVISYIVERYGEFVLMRPRLSLYTWALWATPLLIIVAGGTTIIFLFRRARTNKVNGLSAEEQAHLKSLLDDPD
jgi:cytochrome c-type biogenesis protein CcmH